MVPTGKNILSKKQPILIHCAQGVIRTGMMVAIYEMEYRHKDNKQTLEQLPMFGHDLYVPKRQRMRDFITNYVPRWKQQNKQLESKVD